MSKQPSDLVKLAQLIKLSAETARLFSDTRSGNGKLSRVTELSQLIEKAALELIEIGKAMEATP